MVVMCSSLLRYVTQLKIILTLSLILNLSLKPISVQYREYFHYDDTQCANCFNTQALSCLEFYAQLVEIDEFHRILESLNKLNRRNMLWLKIHDNNTHIIGKSYTIKAKYASIPVTTSSIDWQQRPGRFQTCNASLAQLITYFEQFGYTKGAIVYYMEHNITPMLMPILVENGLPVPYVYATCGLTIFQAYAGLTLTHYYVADYTLRLNLARKLLQLALKFTYGFDNFRIYITDFSADNFAYDEATRTLTIIDLDTIFIAYTKTQSSFQKHDVIPSNCAFTYVPDIFCNTKISDINIYAACQLLRENICGDRNEGFLKPNEMKTQLRGLIDRCVDCPATECKERFTVANEIIRFLEAAN